MKLNDEFVNGIDGCTYQVLRTLSNNTYEIQMVADKHQTMNRLLSQGKSAGFNTEKQRIATASKWFKQILKERGK